MIVSILGLGWFGKPLAETLKDAGHKVKGSVTTEEKAAKLILEGLEVHPLKAPSLPNQNLLSADVIVLNIPPFPSELEWFKSWKWNPKTWIIFISSTSGKLEEQEKWVQESFQTWTVLRFAGLVGPDRHPGNSLSGKKDLKGGKWPVNLLHLEDAVGFAQRIIESKIIHESIDVLCDEHHSREEFYQEYCRQMSLPAPLFDPTDLSTRAPLCNARAKELYQFKWSTMFGRSL